MIHPELLFCLNHDGFLVVQCFTRGVAVLPVIATIYVLFWSLPWVSLVPFDCYVILSSDYSLSFHNRIWCLTIHFGASIQKMLTMNLLVYLQIVVWPWPPLCCDWVHRSVSATFSCNNETIVRTILTILQRLGFIP